MITEPVPAIVPMDTDQIARAANGAIVRPLYADLNHRLMEAFKAGTDVDALVHRKSEIIDELLRALWRKFDLTDTGHTLVAIGGYGRGELFPHSDIDLLFLTADAPDETACANIGALSLFLWDIGMAVGHSVRTLDECETIARDDLSVITSLRESRWLCGDTDLYEDFQSRIAPGRIWPSPAFFTAKLAEQTERHRKYGDTAYHLEPNVKEGPGGLRDIQMIGWIGKTHFSLHRLSELVEAGLMNSGEYTRLKSAQSFLWKVRFSLHLLTGRAEDRLLFENQKAIAELLGFHNDNANLAVEKFMQRYYRNAGEVIELNETLLAYFQHAILHSDNPPAITAINDQFQINGGFLQQIDPLAFQKQPSRLLELFLHLGQHPDILGIDTRTIRAAREALPLIDERFRRDPRHIHLFLDILRQPSGPSRSLRMMHRLGVLSKYIPDFRHIAGQMQFDLFHAYTVDEHTLRVIEHMEQILQGHCPIKSAAFERFIRDLDTPEIPYLAALFHDIGKGRGGDHSTIGAQEAIRFCQLHELPENTTQLVAWLIENHLLLSMTAQRKDISDPAIIAEFAQAVGDRTHLNHLLLLTIADIMGTNPQLWNAWRQTLFTELYQETEALLQIDHHRHRSAGQIITQKQSDTLSLLRGRAVSTREALFLWEELSEDYFIRHTADEIAWHTESILNHIGSLPIVDFRTALNVPRSELFVYTQDAPFLFARLTAALAKLDINVASARITSSRHEKVLDSFIIMDSDDQPITDAHHTLEIIEALRLAAQNAGAPPPLLQQRYSRRMRTFIDPPAIAISHEGSTEQTVLHISATDYPGLLANIANLLAGEHLLVHNAKILTLGEKVDDTFYLSDAQGRPLNDPQQIETLKNKLTTALQPRPDEIPLLPSHF